MVTNNHLLMRKKLSFFLFSLSRWLATGRRQKWCWCCFRFFSLKNYLSTSKGILLTEYYYYYSPTNPNTTLLLPTTYFFFSPLLGIFFVLPCIESYQKVDLRTITLGVPPQEVRSFFFKLHSSFLSFEHILLSIIKWLLGIKICFENTYFFQK